MDSVNRILVSAWQQRVNLFCSAICLALFTTSLLSAYIGGAEAEYSYDEFLIRDLSLEDYAPQVYRLPVQTRLLSIGQSYTLNNYLTSFIGRSDSLWAFAMEASYKDEVYRGSLDVSYRDSQTLIYNYFAYPHKEQLNLSSLELHNRFILYSADAERRLAYRNIFRGFISHDSTENTDLTSFSNSGILDWQHETHLIGLGFAIPPYHNEEHYQIRSHYSNQKTAKHKHRIHAYQLGIGLTATKTGNGTSFFPVATFSYNRHSQTRIALSLEESFIPYPVENYFSGNGLLWKSSPAVADSSRIPVAAKQLKGSLDFTTGRFRHQLWSKYSHSESSFRYFSNDDDNGIRSYTIKNMPEKQDSWDLAYTIRYNSSNLSAAYRLQGDREFEPELRISGSTEIFIRLFHSLLFDLAYYHDYQSLFDEGRVSFTTVKAIYRYANLKNLSLELGIFYSSFEPSGNYWDNRPSLFTQVRYGTF